MTSGGEKPPGESFADEAFAVAVAAYAAAAESWELGVHRAVSELFAFLGGRPDETFTCVTSDGNDWATRRDHAIARFSLLLEPGFARSASLPRPTAETDASAPPRVVTEAVGGAIHELIRAHAVERRLDRLAEAAPEATVLVLSPFLGPDAAFAVVGGDDR